MVVCVWCVVSKQELKRLFRRFKKLDTDKSGTLSVPEFLAIPELEHNPLVRRVVATFDADKSGEVDFQEFITALSVFAQTDGKDQKFKCTTYNCSALHCTSLHCAHRHRVASSSLFITAALTLTTRLCLSLSLSLL